jgi:iron complex outermembrane recepter protein
MRFDRKQHFDAACLGRAVFFTTCLTLSLSSPSKARTDDYFDLSPEQLISAEVISVSKKAEPVAQAPAAIYVITHEDISRTGVTSIPDALRMAPGVDVAQGDSNSWAINIRGFNKGLANQLLVMVDGRTLYNPLFAGTYWELQNMPLEDIERIEVIRGPGGTLWGANAVNGVINIITKKAQDTQGKLVSVAAGNYVRDFGLGQIGGKINDNSWYRAYIQHFNNGSFKNPDGDDAGDAWHDNRAGFRIDWGDKLTVSGDAYTNRSGQLVSVPQFTPPYAMINEDNMESQGANLLAHWKNKFGDGSLLALQAYADYTARDQLILRDEREIFDFNGQYNFPVRGRNEIIVGGGYRMTHDNLGNTRTLTLRPSRNTDSLFNVFAQDKIALVPDHWYLTLGSKAEYRSDIGLEFEPNARLQWFPDDHQAIWAAVSRALRTPSPIETDINLNAGVFPPGILPLEFNLAANPHFDSERLIAYELGYRNQITSDLAMDVAAFYNNYNGLAAQQFQGLSLVNNGVDPPYFLFQTNQANLMAAETHGIEIAAEWSVSKSWKLTGSYSFQEMFIHLDNDFTNQQAQEMQSPRHQANLRSYWNINKDWVLNTSVNYVSRLSAFDVPAYIRLDMNLGWHVAPRVKFNLIGQNLLQGYHREFGNGTDLNASEVPRSVFGKVTWEF